MKILVIGATSGVGLATVEAALARGHEVRAMARGAGDMEPRAGLEPFAGDATDPADMDRAVAGMDAVIFALGLHQKVGFTVKEVRLFSDGAKALLPAMAAHGVRRLVAVSGFGAGDSRGAFSLVERLGHKALLGRAYDDKDRMEKIVMGADLDWTIVRPVILTDGRSTGRARVVRDPAQWRNGLIARAEVAELMLDMLDSGDFAGEAVVLTR